MHLLQLTFTITIFLSLFWLSTVTVKNCLQKAFQKEVFLEHSTQLSLEPLKDDFKIRHLNKTIVKTSKISNRYESVHQRKNKIEMLLNE